MQWWQRHGLGAPSHGANKLKRRGMMGGRAAGDGGRVNKPSEGVSGVRIPQQARGQARKETIVDAVAALVAREGIEAVTMHKVAREAGASTGSMYHFFRHRDQLVDTLAQRHTEQLKRLVDSSVTATDQAWRTMSNAQTIKRLFGPPLAYFVRHPDALATLHFLDQGGAKMFQEHLERVMRLRLGRARGKTTAETLYAVATGTLLQARDMQPGTKKRVIRNIPQVLTAYLDSIA